MGLVVVKNPDQNDLEEIFKLRYKVFCEEWKFEKPENHSNRMITDPYDKSAVHFAAKDDFGRIVGAIMLIINPEGGYPVERYCELNIDPQEIPKETVGEISRLVIHRDFRRRAEDKYIYGPDEERRSIGSFDFPDQYQGHQVFFRRADDRFKYRIGMRRSGDIMFDRRRRHEVVISLYKAVYQESKRVGLTHWYSMMTKGIVNLLSRFGFVFRPIGDPVDYHGIRTPYLAEIAEIDKQMSERNPELFKEFMNGL